MSSEVVQGKSNVLIDLVRRLTYKKHFSQFLNDSQLIRLEFILVKLFLIYWNNVSQTLVISLFK